MQPIATSFLVTLASLLATASTTAHAQQGQRVKFHTSAGSFVVALDPERAPLSVKNFLEYARAGHYEGTLFHRVIGNFVAQGGGYDIKYVERPQRAPIANESGNGLSNVRGTIAMARTENPHSATAQFFLNLADNARLDPQPSRWGYAVFGRVIEGMNVLDDIGSVATGAAGPFDSDAPLKPIVIEKVEEVK